MLETIQYELITAALAMVPVIEVRGAIPVGVAGGLRPLTALICAILGSMIPAPFLIILLRKVLDYLKVKGYFPKFVTFLETRARNRGGIVQRYSLPGLFILVAIPLPGTGVWTGSLVASLLNLPCRRALPTIFAGTVVASAIMAVLSYGVAALI